MYFNVPWKTQSYQATGRIHQLFKVLSRRINGSTCTAGIGLFN
nr:hypothetical protein [uncultured Prevotella sp.]